MPGPQNAAAMAALVDSINGWSLNGGMPQQPGGYAGAAHMQHRAASFDSALPQHAAAAAYMAQQVRGRVLRFHAAAAGPSHGTPLASDVLSLRLLRARTAGANPVLSREATFGRATLACPSRVPKVHLWLTLTLLPAQGPPTSAPFYLPSELETMMNNGELVHPVGVGRTRE
jgi:hypothetical protein